LSSIGASDTLQNEALRETKHTHGDRLRVSGDRIRCRDLVVGVLNRQFGVSATSDAEPPSPRVREIGQSNRVEPLARKGRCYTEMGLKFQAVAYTRDDRNKIKSNRSDA
jgi:hypothetical protein